MSDQNKWFRICGRVLALAGSTASFIACFLLLLRDKSTSAGVAATLCLALGILGLFELEMFKGFGIEARLRSTLSEAEDRLRLLDGILISLARTTFLLATRGPTTFEEKRSLIQDVTTGLRSCGVAASEIRKAQKIIGREVLSNLYHVYTQMRSHYISSALVGPEQMSALPNLSPYGGEDLATFKERLLNDARNLPCENDAGRQRLVDFARKLGALAEECVDEGNYTEGAIPIFTDGQTRDSPWFIEQLNVLLGTWRKGR